MNRQMLAQSQEEAGKCPNWGRSHEEEDHGQKSPRIQIQ
jgi:hypothetical protein